VRLALLKCARVFFGGVRKLGLCAVPSLKKQSKIGAAESGEKEMSDEFGAEEFQELCRSEFHFLEEDYGFVEQELGKVGTINRRHMRVQYVSPKTWVLVVGESYAEDLGVWFGPTERVAPESSPGYNLQDLLQIRRPDLLEKTIGELANSDEPTQIRHYARALKESADDVLRGDFSIQPQLEEIIDRRRKELTRLYRREWLKNWKLSFQGCMARWRRKLRAGARH
jgi:hypothetical protein